MPRGFYGRGFWGPGYWGWGGNPYPFCRWFPGLPVGGGLPLMPPIMPQPYPDMWEQDTLPTIEEG
jgi:hypothetical protein